MRTLWLDYETYYDDQYSLSKMIRTEYLHDPRFKSHGCAFAIDDGDFFWVTGTDLPAFFKDVAPHIDAMCCHNGLFDHGITSLFYMPERKFLMDTMSMAQVALSRKNPGQRMSLAKLAQYYFPNNPEWWKFEGILENFKGVVNLGAKEPIMAKYAIQDGVVMRELFKALLREDVPWHTMLEDIDLTLGMGVYPQLEMDTELATAINAKEVAAKEQAVIDLNLTRAQLRSGEKFAELLRAQGVPPPLKKNAKGDLIYAFAANDLDFMELADHENPIVRALHALRIGEKSAQTMTRSARWMTLPTSLPIPLKVAGAHTGRHGGDEYNMQNPEKAGDLRKCIKAPKGKKLVVGDLAGIELRVNAWWCDERTLLDKWEIDPEFDVYSELGGAIFGRNITKADLEERFAAKTSELASQFGAGAARIQLALRQKKVACSDELALRIRNAYRGTRTKVRDRWKWLQDIAIPAMAGMAPTVEMKGVRFEFGRAVLPSGRSLYYPELHVNEEGDWVYKAVKKFAVYWKKLYGGALLENLIQAMAYDVFMHQQRLAKRTLTNPLAMAVHDEGVFVVVETWVAHVLAQLKQIYKSKPDWFQGVPIFGEFGIGDNYKEAK
jgi:DNA polymerase